MKFRLALFYGGPSGEHEVSRISAASIFRNLDPGRYDIHSVGISQAGEWFLQKPWDPTSIEKEGRLPLDTDPRLRLHVVPGRGIFLGTTPQAWDMAFLINHGIGGEDGRIQGLLDCVGVPFTGAGVLGSALGMDKALAKQVWAYNGLPVVPFLLLERHLWKEETSYGAKAFDEAREKWGLPLFVKPSNSGSSVGVSRAEDETAFLEALETAFVVDRRVLVEPAVDAREVEVAVLGTHRTRAFAPGEILPNHEFYDYDAKYLDPDGARLLIPADLDPSGLQEVQDLAVRAFRALDCRGFARVDFFWDRRTGRPVLNEINTLPGFTTISMFPRMCMAGGLTYPEILDAIIDDAKEFAQT